MGPHHPITSYPLRILSTSPTQSMYLSSFRASRNISQVTDDRCRWNHISRITSNFPESSILESFRSFFRSLYGISNSIPILFQSADLSFRIFQQFRGVGVLSVDEKHLMYYMIFIEYYLCFIKIKFTLYANKRYN